MNEKEMVLDILSGAKSSLDNYAKVIMETGNPTLRQTFQQMRDGDEKFQYDLYKIAEQKGYYLCSPDATAKDREHIRSSLSGAASIPSMS